MNFKFALLYLAYVSIILFIMLLIGNGAVNTINIKNIQILQGNKMYRYMHKGRFCICIADIKLPNRNFQCNCNTQDLDDAVTVNLSDGTR